MRRRELEVIYDHGPLDIGSIGVPVAHGWHIIEAGRWLKVIIFASHAGIFMDEDYFLEARPLMDDEVLDEGRLAHSAWTKQ